MAQRRSLAWTELRVGILVIVAFIMLALGIFYVATDGCATVLRLNHPNHDQCDHDRNNDSSHKFCSLSTQNSFVLFVPFVAKNKTPSISVWKIEGV